MLIKCHTFVEYIPPALNTLLLSHNFLWANLSAINVVADLT